MSGSRNAPATRPDRDATPATVDQVRVIRAELDRYSKVVERLLARTDVSADEFTAWVANACRATPKLWACDPATVVGAALRCAQLMLPPNDGNNLAWMIPYNGSATFQLGYGGVLELARRAEPGLRFDGRPVYAGDAFDLDYGRTPPLKHKPWHSRRPPRARGEAVLWYVRATFPDGHELVHTLDRDGVKYHRGFSKQRNGEMWTKSYDAAALKSVVLDMRRWLPHTPALTAGVRADGAVVDVRAMSEDAPELPTPTETELGAGAVDDSTVAEAELETTDDPDAAADAEWREQALITDEETTP